MKELKFSPGMAMAALVSQVQKEILQTHTSLYMFEYVLARVELDLLAVGPFFHAEKM
jgi:hypothetical protein